MSLAITITKENIIFGYEELATFINKNFGNTTFIVKEITLLHNYYAAGM